MIEGVVGSNRDGFLGIDDISFTPGCIIDFTATKPTTKTTITTPSIISPKTTTTVKPITPTVSTKSTTKKTSQCPICFPSCDNEQPNCQNGGECKVSSNKYYCECKAEFTGTFCEIKIEKPIQSGIMNKK